MPEPLPTPPGVSSIAHHSGNPHLRSVPFHNEQPTPRATVISSTPHRTAPRRVTPSGSSSTPPERHVIGKAPRRRQAVAAIERSYRAERRNPQTPRNRRFCKYCKISCNSTTTFYDHMHSRRHNTTIENLRCSPICEPCDRYFASHRHLQVHLMSAAHTRVVSRNSHKK